MHSGYRYISSLFLVAALVTPPGIMAARQPDEHRQEEHHDKDKRYYDKDHKDYHDWNDNEDREYRQYLNEHHKEYRDFSKGAANNRNTGTGVTATQTTTIIRQRGSLDATPARCSSEQA
jgi:hypothetical protein